MEYSKESAKFYAFTEWRRGKHDRDIHQALFDVWAYSAPGYSTVARWTASFSPLNHVMTTEKQKRGRPVTESGDFNSSIVSEIVEENPHLSTREIQSMTGIPHMTVWRILTRQLNMQLVTPYWVPQNLTTAQKQNRVLSAQGILQRLMDMGQSRYSNYVVVDETWINFDKEYTVSSSKQWLPTDHPRPQVVSTHLTARKCMAIVAFSACARFSVEILPYGETIDGDRYIRFVHKTGEKWRTLRTTPARLDGLVWQHDNARPHVKKEVVEFF